MIFKRTNYLNKMIQKRHNGLIKVITGIRRSGKTYLVFTLFKDYLVSTGVDGNHIVEMSFDSYENIKYRDPDVFYPYIKSLIADDKTYYILLDEIQLLDQFESVLNGLLRLSNTDLYVTGSNAKFLSKDILTEFRGRGDEIYVGPLSFSEFMEEYKGHKIDGWNEYMLYGGLPPVVNLNSAQEKIALLNSLFQQTYIKDVLGRNKLQKKDALEDILNFLSSSIGSLTNPVKLSATFKSVKNVTISDKTVSKYIDCLCDAFLVKKAYRYDVKGKHYLDSPFKYYFIDIGLRNARINFRQLEETHTMENIIFNELVMRGYNVDVGIVPFSERNKKGIAVKKQAQIDFLCNKGSSRYYVQCIFSMSDEQIRKKKIYPLNKTKDSFRKIVIVKDAPAPWFTDEGILIMSIYDFLLNPDSLDMQGI